MAESFMLCWLVSCSACGLKSYFLSCSEAETPTVVKILKQLENPLTTPVLLFLSYVLMDKF